MCKFELCGNESQLGYVSETGATHGKVQYGAAVAGEATWFTRDGLVALCALCAVMLLSACGGAQSNRAASTDDAMTSVSDDTDNPFEDVADLPDSGEALPDASDDTVDSVADNAGLIADERDDTPADTGNDSSSPDSADELVDSQEFHNTVFIPDASDITDNQAVYDLDGYANVDVVRIDLKTRTVAGVCEEDDQSGCTLDDVLSDINSTDSFKVDIPVHFMATDFADDGSMNNAELRQRGGGTRVAAQKSFRIKLDDKDVLWRGERHLQLNKHPFDNSRIRNKLAFDLMSDIEHLPSFRMQFVNLWIDDGNGPFNQGLYTHAERGDKRYLKRHNLDDDDRLYKASNFSFHERDRRELLINDEGKPLDKDIFESVLEIENGKDHSALVSMLDALHDPEQSFESVMGRFFNENNVLTWVAVNLLLGQQDATRHNYYLYNPQDSEKFYFLPWDYDFAFQEHDLPSSELSKASLKARLKYGYAVGSQNEFLKRYYSRPGAHERILAAADELRNSYLDNATIVARAEHLSSVVAPYASAQPDIAFNEYYSARSSADFADKVAFNHDAMVNHFGIPLPPTLSAPELHDEQWRFSWQRAVDLTGATLTYRLQLATSPSFQPDSVVAEFDGIENNSSSTITFPLDASQFLSGVHYARLFAISENSPEINWQIADNELYLEGDLYYGVESFIVQ